MGRRGSRGGVGGEDAAGGEKDERTPEEWEERKRGDEAGLGKGEKKK